jgi:hypothetical protein
MYLCLFLTPYMFRAHRAHHQERQIVSIQPVLAVTLCRWPCRVHVGSEHHRGWFGGVQLHITYLVPENGQYDQNIQLVLTGLIKFVVADGKC